MYSISKPRTLSHYLLLAVTVSLLVSCTAGDATPPVDQVATAVAATLSAYPTKTPLPTVTAVSSPTEEASETPTATDTPTPGPSPTATVPPLPAGDPRTGLNLSQPDYRDQFNLNTTWGGPNNEAARNLIKDGHLEATDLLTDTYVWWSTTVPEGRDVYVEVSAKFSSCSGKDSAGLGLRIGGEQYDNGYTLEVSCDRHFRVRRFSGGVVDTLIDWSHSDEILPGPESTNLLGFAARGNALHIFVNRILVASTEDDSFYSGNFALYSNALETPGLIIQFDDFELWYY